MTGVTLHYTAGPAGQTVREIAAYQTSPAAAPQTGTGRPFPGIAYTIVVTADGTPHLCWDLDTAVWHSAAVVGGHGRNLTHVGLCYTGDDGPNAAQIGGLAAAIAWVEERLGRRLAIEGHRDAPYATACPGPRWPGWRADLERALATARGGTAEHGGTAEPVVGAYFRDFLAVRPEWGRPRFDEAPFPGGVALWTIPTPEHPLGGLLVYRPWLGRVRAVAWEDPA
ncbi:MAG: peptidoglycan recognition family protein [Dehalococcoidia bacterium]